MPLSDFVRSFLGLNPRFVDGSSFDDPRFRNPIWNDDDEDDDSEGLADENVFNSFPGSGFNIFSSDPFEIHKFFEQQMEEMLKNFQWFNTQPGSHQMYRHSPKELEEEVFHRSPRDRYLKPSASHKQDADVTDKVSGSEVMDMFEGRGDDESFVTGGGGGGGGLLSKNLSTIFTKTLRRPNGGMEEEMQVNRNGREEITKTRTLGDMKHIVTLKKDLDGSTKKFEQFINFDEDQLGDFEKKWRSEPKKVLPAPPRHEVYILDRNQTDRTAALRELFESLFK